MKIWARLMKFKCGFGLMCHIITPSIPALPIHVFWTSYVFLKEYSCGISFSGASTSKKWFSDLNLSYFAKFKYILMQPHRSEFGASWSQYCQTIGTVISECNFKTGSVRFSMCHLIFWPNFSIIDQHLVLVWCNLHVFLTIFTALYGWNNLFSEM